MFDRTASRPLTATCISTRDTAERESAQSRLPAIQSTLALGARVFALIDSGVSGFRPVDPKQSFVELEHALLETWKEEDLFGRQLELRAHADTWSFYEGPPTANGKPGSHHVLARAFKDIYPRYRAMAGASVPRKAGWDCHGLPVELEVEKELGISSKEEIEEYGIAEFNAKCRESVFRYVDDWNKLSERIGFWIDLDDPYVTMTDDYIESVWWALRQIWDAGRLYQGYKVVPVLPALRDGALLTRGRAGLPGRRRPVRLRPPARHRGAARRRDPRVAGPGRGQPPRLDHYTLDPDLPRGRRSRRRDRIRAREARRLRRGRDPGRSARRARPGRRLRVARFLPRLGAQGRALRGAVRVTSPARTSGRWAIPSSWATSSRPTTAPASSTPRSLSARTTSAWARSTA